MSTFFQNYSPFVFIAAIAVLMVAAVLAAVYISIKYRTQRSIQKMPILDQYLIEVFIHSQSRHLLSSTFPLDEILITPAVIAPPPFPDPDDPQGHESIISEILPFTPDWLEFHTAYGAKRLPVADLLKTGLNVALLGQPGVGKSTALHHLAAVYSSRVNADRLPEQRLPVLIYAHTLVEYHQKEDPIKHLARIVADQYQKLPAGDVMDLVHSSFKEGKLLILIDGMDDLPLELFNTCAQFIRQLFQSQPANRFAITCPIDFTGDLLELNFYPYIMANWQQVQVDEYYEKFTTVWKKYYLTPEASLSSLHSSTGQDVTLQWINHQNFRLNALEWTLWFISIFSGKASPGNSFDIINSYIDMIVPEKDTRGSLEVLAYQTIISENPIINKYEIDHYLPHLAEDTPAKNGKSDEYKASSALSLISKKTILQETLTGNIMFTHSVFLGFLASNALIRNGQYQVVFSQHEWIARNIALMYLTHILDVTQYLDLNGMDAGAPLFSQLFRAGRWMSACKKGSIWQPQVLRRLATLINSDNQPTSVRSSAAQALAISGEASVVKFFHQQVISNSPISRQLAALAIGLLRASSEIKELFGLLSDPEPDVRNAACLALHLFDPEETNDIILQALYQGDETIRRIAAELLAQVPGRGYQELKNAATHEDILVRRAVVFGLSQINEQWSRDILFNMQIQDGQWVVKNAAAQSLQSFEVSSHIPRPLPPPHICPWLVRVAGSLGMGISPTRAPVDVFIKILDTGSQEEKIGVLEYLSHIQSEGMIAQVYDLLYGNPDQIQQAAFYALWRLSLSGNALPSTIKYGFK